MRTNNLCSTVQTRQFNMSPRASGLFVVFIVAFSIIGSVLCELVTPTVWPQPSKFSQGKTEIVVVPFTYSTTTSTGSSSAPKTLSLAYERYNKIIFDHTPKADAAVKASNVNVKIADPSEAYPQIDTDESYTLDILSSDSITLTAQTVYGALRGLETLSQLVAYDFESEKFVIPATPISIDDKPRYNHRGLLLDTSRHFQPIEGLQHTIDALSYAKMNVLHWHVVDTQSFPFESVSYPKLWDGSYSSREKYSQADIIGLVEYGRQRGVKIMIEFDMPGHAASWCKGYPEICPSASCLQPLNPASNLTFPLIDSLLAECTGRASGAGLFPYNFLHLGGDEVSYTCWELSPQIKLWEQQQGLSGSEATYEYFVNKAASITRSQQRTPIQWVEVFEHFGSNLDKNTVVHVWKEKQTMDAAVQAGYRVLLSDQDLWYLDHLGTTWEQMYLNEPNDGLSSGADPSLVIGGEACMWGETVDRSDLDATIWPRAAAVAERLWTPQSEMQSTEVAINRLQTFRCLLNQRGVAAAPVTNDIARYQPPEPGSCYVQRKL